jgi:hypothetical protein
MVAKKRSGAVFEAQKFVQSLSGLIDALPSDAGKQETILQLETLIQFLSDLKKRIESIPTSQDTASAHVALNHLATLFAQAKSNPVLGAAIGIKATVPRQRSPDLASEDVERANSAVTRLNSLPIDELRATLDRMSQRELQGVAGVIGVRASQRTARDTLVHQIATKITNRRGYRSLRDGAG